MAIVYPSKVRGVGLDKVCWKQARSRGGFEVRRFYLSFYPPSYSLLPLEFGVAIKGPSKGAFFSWSASLVKILTTDNLHRRSIIVLDWCYMCKRWGELVDLLVLHCPIAYELWSLVFCLFGLHWVMPLKVVELFEFWQGS